MAVLDPVLDLARIASGQESPELVQRLAAAALVVHGGWRT